MQIGLLNLEHIPIQMVPTFELEIDKYTGLIKILNYTVVDDFGKVINPLLLEGQVHGGIAQGIGQALFEETIYDNELVSY